MLAVYTLRSTARCTHPQTRSLPRLGVPQGQNLKGLHLLQSRRVLKRRGVKAVGADTEPDTVLPVPLHSSNHRRDVHSSLQTFFTSLLFSALLLRYTLLAFPFVALCFLRSHFCFSKEHQTPPEPVFKGKLSGLGFKSGGLKAVHRTHLPLLPCELLLFLVCLFSLHFYALL